MKPFTTLAVVFLALLALAQATRFLLGWEVTIHGYVVPVWSSGIAFVIAGGIAAGLVAVAQARMWKNCPSSELCRIETSRLACICRSSCRR